ncbi:MAG: indolepyruvate oxidoreductase subunit beta [Firmicutes bacterium]|nr:indolepyruvate oxidoreductase subunit beta [Bacillota bacterium]
MPKVTNIALAGVGGQGIILAGNLLAQAAALSGYDVKLAEVHGMAQRGGSVITQVRFGEKVYSPTFGKGSADYLVAFERLEALRHQDILADDGVLLLSDTIIQPITTATGSAPYPRDILDRLKKKCPRFYSFSAEYKAEKLGNPKVANVLMLGVLSIFLEEILEAVWEEALELVVPPKHLELNRLAFAEGRALGNQLAHSQKVNSN